MPSRQDQLHSYQFAVQRVVAALVMRETDPAQSPFRRAAGATLASVLVALITLGAVAVYGVLVGGGSQRWRTAKVVLVEADSGTRFVFQDGKLHPVLNFASGALIVGNATKPTRVSRKSIRGVPRGSTLGIANAPDTLPDRRSMLGHPWTVCSAAVPGGGSGPQSTLMVGADPAGGNPLGERGVLVRDTRGGAHLVWQQRRHLIRDEGRVLRALGWAGQAPTRVATALLNSLPAGADLGLIRITGRGEAFRHLPKIRVGEVIVVKGQTGGDQFVVALRNGLAPITAVQVALLLNDPETVERVGQRAATPLLPGDIIDVPQLADLVPDEGAPPATTPTLAPADTGALCAVARDDAGVAEVRVGARVPDVADASRTSTSTPDGAVLADYILVPPGRGALVEAVPAAGVQGGTMSLVTDLGRRYAVPTADVLASIGLAAVKPARLPANVVALLPGGPALDPQAARAVAQS